MLNAAIDSNVISLRCHTFLGLALNQDHARRQPLGKNWWCKRSIGSIRKATLKLLIIKRTVPLCDIHGSWHCVSSRTASGYECPRSAILAQRALARRGLAPNIVAPSDMMDGRVGAFAKPC